VDVHELTAAYALDALEPDERDRYESHLAQCESCRAELAELGETAAALAYGVASPAPPPELRTRILDAAAAERSNVVSLPRRRNWLAGVAAAAACAALGFGIWGATLSSSLDSERSARAAEHRAMEIYMDPSAKHVGLRGRAGTVAVDQTGQGVLVVNRLPAAPDGKTYEAWVIPPGSKPIRAGLFEGGKGMTMVPLGTNVPTGSVVAATVEPRGGVDAPTAQPVFSAQT
jgi:anti-sigma-K factor RskA